LQSALVVPLAARGAVLGAMTLIRSASQTPYTESDLPFITELARRAGIAVDNARLLHEATESVRLRDDFLATASHDMRTPLATVLGYLQIAQRHVNGMPDPGRVPDFLSRAERTALRLARLVAELMDVSLIRAGQKLPLAIEEVNLSALVERAAAEHWHLSQRHEITMTPRTGEAVIAVTDESRVERILDNLLSNAVKSSAEGSEIVLTTAVDGDDALVTVTDSGVGIPPEELPIIFERFHRASTAGGAPGVGLGLAGSRDVARQLGGDITVTSEPGKGSSFTVRIPRHPREVAERPDEAQASS
jgi:signal transduction histidine kinase